MPLLIRRVLIVVVFLAFVLLTALPLFGVTLPGGITLVFGILTAVIGGAEATSWLFDRFVPDKSRERRPIPISTDPKDRIDGYLSGMLTRFEKEESVFVPLPLETRIKPKYSPIAEKRDFDSIDQALELYDSRFVLIGAPGAGKSTTLRDLMRQHIRLYRDNPTTALLPFWIDLGFSGNPVDAAELIAYWWTEQAYLPDTAERYLKQNRVILFLDGLNEMPEAGGGRKPRADSLRTFLEKHPDQRVIVTCRVSEYKRPEADRPIPDELRDQAGNAAPPIDLDRDRLDLGLKNVIEVKPLDLPRMEALIANHKADETLIDRIKADAALMRMAENPYTLTMLIEVAKGRKTLPASLNELYTLYLKATYDRNRADREKRDQTALVRLEWDALEKRLKRLAYRMIVRGNGTAAPYQWAQRQIGTRALKDGINLGVLVESGGEVRYFHQSLQGFFAVERLSRVLSAKPIRILKRERYLFTPDPIQLIRQIGDLGENGAPAVEAIIRVIQRKLPSHEEFNVLFKIGIPSVVPLIGLLNTTADKRSRIRAAITLGRIGEARAVEPLITLLGDTDEDIRFNAAYALGLIGDNRAVESLILSLMDNSWQVRKFSASSLGMLRDSRAVAPLAATLSDSNNSPLAVEVAGALGQIGAPAVTALLQLLNNSDPNVRINVTAALEMIGDSRAAEPLIACLRDPNESVRRSAAAALGRISDARAVEPLIACLHDPNEYVRSSAAKALSKIGDARALELLIARLRNPDRTDRRSAALALGKIGDARAVEFLIPLLFDVDNDVRTYTADALGQIGDRQAVEPLISCLHDLSWNVRSSAAAALRKFDTPEAREALAKYEKGER